MRLAIARAVIKVATAALCLLDAALRAELIPLPAQAEAMPKLLSQTGAFSDLASLQPAAELLPYDLNVPFWSDGAAKQRWIVLPARTTAPSKIHYASTGE